MMGYFNELDERPVPRSIVIITITDHFAGASKVINCSHAGNCCQKQVCSLWIRLITLLAPAT